ncbi:MULTISPECIES: hypothetical protein [unclassified Ketobacter]|uniref:hypothetical protein n=1 Tax=unclassified Ketobacter TaxID=2639109 RepID=UPI0025C1F04C|nr:MULTISPECIES: hypothetical protein [unclassified Ketobacter]
MFVLKGILRAESQEKILIYLLLNGSGYGKSIAEFWPRLSIGRIGSRLFKPQPSCCNTT